MAHKRAPSEGEPPHKRVSRQQEDAEQENNVRPNYHHSQQSTAEEGEAGIVESITLKNFMCHTLLGPFTFGSNVNFVVGNNGSGKSAVLTALIVALGGTAQATNRGASLKGFVKEGESSAEVSVTLRNTGRDAYKLEDYGQAVIIDLKLTRDGMRTFKLKSKSGQIVSTKKEDLMSILDNFNIQVNNPVSILTQEMSKHFLHSKSEGDKYKFFMKATQLEQMKLDFISIKTAKQYTEEKVSQNGECLRDLKKTYLEKEDNYKSLSSLDDMQAKLEELQKQMAWCLVAEMEAELLPVRQKLKSDQLSTQKFDDKVEEWKNKVTEGERKYKQIHDQLNGLTERVQELQPQSTQLKAVAQRQDSLLKAGEVTFHLCKKSLKILESDRGQLCSRIKELKLSISQATGAESQLKDRRMQELQAELQDLSHQDSTLGQQIEQYQQATHRAKEELGKLRNEQSGLQKSIDANSRNLLTLKASSSNRLRRFGEHMPGLLKAIQDAHRAGQLKERPRGPLGYCISLKDPQMALAVEVCLKGQLQAFACDNHKDENVLQGLMARVFPSGQRPGIITSRFLDRVHDTSRRCLCGRCRPMESVVESLCCREVSAFWSLVEKLSPRPADVTCLTQHPGFDACCLNPFVLKIAYTHFKQDHGPLQASTHEGVDHPTYPSVLQSLEVEDPVVANCLIDQRGIERILLIRNAAEARAVMAKPPRNCTQAFSVEGDQIFENRSWSAEQSRPNFLFGDVEEEIRHLQREMENQTAQVGCYQQRKQKVEEDIGKNEDLLKKAHVEQKKTQGKERKLQLELTELQNMEELQSEDLQPLEEDLEEVVGKIASQQAQCEEARAQMAQLKANFEEAEQQDRKLKDQISAMAEEADSMKEDLTNSDQEYELAASVTKATEICPERLEVRRTARNLDNEINLVKTKITTQQAQQGNREEIVKQYKEAYEKYKDTAQQMKCLKSFIRTLNQIITDRLKAYNSLRSMLSARCKYYFDSLLFQRGYTGSMTFNHNDETLFISVQPGEGDKAELSDMRSLSGGERSFSTVCFVLSLWAITEAPFRCLDEFDVYMDMVNRRISMDMMLKIADSQRYRQFVFLTPQSMSSLPESKFIRILRMKDPERGSQDQASSREDPA
uniref:RecF/RecN/SMC N-terminal domain-containing protein n=1 Tax=Gadus morhua TaxID=8049 RepID=A0A8C5CZA4_GADMO